MKASRRVARLMLLAALTAPAFGQSAPEGFRHVKWGATQDEVWEAFPHANCQSESTESSDWSCTVLGEDVNGVRVDVILRGYTTGRVVGMSAFSLHFQSEDVRRLVGAFESRYGRWTRVEEKEVLSKEGGRLPNAQWVWEFRHVTVRISQHGREPDNA